MYLHLVMTLNPHIQQQDAQLILNALIRFCQTTGRACYVNWSAETLRDYLVFHINQDTLVWVRDTERGPFNIIGCAIAWQCDAREVQAAHAADRLLFQWQPTNPNGDCLFIADVVAVNRNALRVMLRQLNRRYPQWHTMQNFTWRRGRPQPVPLSRLMRKELYGQRRR